MIGTTMSGRRASGQSPRVRNVGAELHERALSNYLSTDPFERNLCCYDWLSIML